MTIAQLIVAAFSAYFSLGLIFAVYFLSIGAARLDHSATTAPWIARALWLPGTIALWPILLLKCMSAAKAGLL